MTRINHTLPFIALAILLASTGCGDPGSFDETAGEDSGRVADGAGSADDTTLTLEDELQLACEAFCDSPSSCRRFPAAEDCAADCVNEVGPEGDEVCTAARIDLLNCYSALSCGSLADDVRTECGEAMFAYRDACAASELRRDGDDDEGIRIVEVGGPELTEVDGDPEEADPSEEPGDEEPGESEDSDPVFELPEIPDYPDSPEIGPVFEFP